MSIEKSTIEIPSEWMENLKNQAIKKEKKEDIILNNFLIENYSKYTISSMARACGKPRATVHSRIEKLKREGKIKDET